MFRVSRVTARTAFALSWSDLLDRSKFKVIRPSIGRDRMGYERNGRNKYIVSHSTEIRAQLRPKRAVLTAVKLNGAMVRSLRPMH